MRLDFGSDGTLVDDLVLDDAIVTVVRSGDARYRLRFESEVDAVLLELWTSQGTIEACLDGSPAPWTRVSFQERILATLTATHVLAHLEQLDRGIYWLGLSREGSWSFRFVTDGYLLADQPDELRSPLIR